MPSREGEEAVVGAAVLPFKETSQHTLTSTLLPDAHSKHCFLAHYCMLCSAHYCMLFNILTALYTVHSTLLLAHYCMFTLAHHCITHVVLSYLLEHSSYLKTTLTVLHRWWERRFHSKTGGERLVGETMDARGEVTPLEFESNLPVGNF